MSVTAPCGPLYPSLPLSPRQRTGRGRKWNLALPHANSGNQIYLLLWKKCLPRPWRRAPRSPYEGAGSCFPLPETQGRPAVQGVGCEVGAAQRGAEAPLLGDLQRLKDPPLGTLPFTTQGGGEKTQTNNRAFREVVVTCTPDPREGWGRNNARGAGNAAAGTWLLWFHVLLAH